MSGILDTKQRILDTIVTLQGRKQMVHGKFQIKFVTFTDGGTFYQADIASGSTDPTGRLFFECSNLPQDQITFEHDDSGQLQPFGNATGFEILSGKIFSGSSVGLVYVTGSAFASTAETVLGSSIDNFQKLQSIGTVDPIFEDDEFLLSDKSVTFTIHDDRPIKHPSLHSVNINHMEQFISDPKLSKVPNFQFLPPINKVLDSQADLFDPVIQEEYFMAAYRPLGPIQKLDFERDVQPVIDEAVSQGYAKTITFDPTTNGNNLALQLFEMRSDNLLKLDVIDFGRFKSNDPHRPDKHVFFAGKILTDDFGRHVFFKIFTLVFE